MDACVYVRFLPQGTDVSKTPHELNLRDGYVITVRSLILNLKVVDETGGEIFFRCKMTTPMERLMRAYANRRQISVHSFALFYNRRSVRPEETPADLDMEDGEELQLERVAVAE